MMKKLIISILIISSLNADWTDGWLLDAINPENDGGVDSNILYIVLLVALLWFIYTVLISWGETKELERRKKERDALPQIMCLDCRARYRKRYPNEDPPKYEIEESQEIDGEWYSKGTYKLISGEYCNVCAEYVEDTEQLLKRTLHKVDKLINK